MICLRKCVVRNPVKRLTDFSLPHMPQRREGVDEALDGGGADAGEVAGKDLRAVGRLPRGLVDHAAHKGDLVGEG